MVGCMYFFEQENERVRLLIVQPGGPPRPREKAYSTMS